MIKRLKIKFVCINMLIVTVMLAVIFGFVLHTTSQSMEEETDRMVQNLHENPVRRGPLFEDRRVPFFTVTVTPQGVFAISSDGFFGDEHDESLLEIAQQVYESGEEQGVLKEQKLRYSRKTTPFGEQLVFVDISVEQSMMQELLKTCGIICVVSYVLFFAISVGLAQWAIRPVETAWKQQRQFVADASHELKTPLTVIMTNAELLQNPAYSPEEQGQFTGSILTMSHQMRGLVEGLLNLARVDNGVVKTVFTYLDLSELVNDCLLPFEPLYFEKGMELVSDLEPGIHIRGSESHLRQVVDILLDNAAKYATPESTVQVQLRRQGIYGLLTVSNPGEEISKEDLKNIFKRFYRIDMARSMNHSYGLGLSIAQGIIQDHGGKIWAESQNGIISFHTQLLLHRHE